MGADWQAKILSKRGFDVKAIDVERNPYAEHHVWYVLNYDGMNISFPDHSFDLVLTSNVLEHTPHIEKFSTEMRRVLKPEGVAIHILPTGNWRFWTSISHYFFFGKVFLFILLPPLCRKCDPTDSAVRTAQMNKKLLLKMALFPSPHGRRGNALSEIYLFSKLYWEAFFRKTDWSIEKYDRNRLFYTGFSIFDSLLSIRFRHILSYFLGSSCHIFVLNQKRQKK